MVTRYRKDTEVTREMVNQAIYLRRNGKSEKQVMEILNISKYMWKCHVEPKWDAFEALFKTEFMSMWEDATQMSIWSKDEEEVDCFQEMSQHRYDNSLLDENDQRLFDYQEFPEAIPIGIYEVMHFLYPDTISVFSWGKHGHGPGICQKGRDSDDYMGDVIIDGEVMSVHYFP